MKFWGPTRTYYRRFGTAAHCGAAGGLENGARIFMVSASKDSIGL